MPVTLPDMVPIFGAGLPPYLQSYQEVQVANNGISADGPNGAWRSVTGFFAPVNAAYSVPVFENGYAPGVGNNATANMYRTVMNGSTGVSVQRFGTNFGIPYSPVSNTFAILRVFEFNPDAVESIQKVYIDGLQFNAPGAVIAPVVPENCMVFITAAVVNNGTGGSALMHGNKENWYFPDSSHIRWATFDPNVWVRMRVNIVELKERVVT